MLDDMLGRSSWGALALTGDPLRLLVYVVVLLIVVVVILKLLDRV